MHTIINTEWGRAYLDEALCILGCPTMLHLAILTEFRLGQIVYGAVTRPVV